MGQFTFNVLDHTHKGYFEMNSYAILFVLATAIAVSSACKKVNCGDREAPSCEECPEGHGRIWCNGECSWNSRTSTCYKPVNCGDHQATDCILSTRTRKCLVQWRVSLGCGNSNMQSMMTKTNRPLCNEIGHDYAL